MPRIIRRIEPSNSLNKIDDDLDNELHDIQKWVDFEHEKNFDVLSITKKICIDQNIKMNNRYMDVWLHFTSHPRYCCFYVFIIDTFHKSCNK